MTDGDGGGHAAWEQVAAPRRDSAGWGEGWAEAEAAYRRGQEDAREIMSRAEADRLARDNAEAAFRAKLTCRHCGHVGTHAVSGAAGGGRLLYGPRACPSCRRPAPALEPGDLEWLRPAPAPEDLQQDGGEQR